MTELLPEFRLAQPHDVAAAIAARREHRTSRYLAGGSDLVVNIRHGIETPAVLIDLMGIEELSQWTWSREGARIGACVTVSELAAQPELRQRYRALAEAAEAIAGPAHRTAATVGGNLCLDTRCIYYNQSQWWRRANAFCLKHRGEICHVAPQGKRCHAAFCGDLAPALIALGGEVEIAGPGGRRRIGLGELYVEDGKAHLTLAVDELVVAVHVPADAPPSSYRKVRTREAIDFPLAGVAVALEVAAGTLKKLRIAVTGTNSRPFLVEGTHALVGKRIDETLLQALDKLVQKQVQPMRTTIASAHYRRLAAAALARRLVAKLAAEQVPAP
ncbi:MAG TPA: 4-hydroxybenzoyl-CoA reductase subunit beta [Xanthobacteraceae bacterium]